MFRVFLTGVVFWLVGTVIVLLTGALLLQHPLPVYAASFVTMGLVARLVFRAFRLPAAEWPKAVTLLALPTLTLDAFMALYLAQRDPVMAAAFGGWMLICCGGAVAGSWLRA
jgi:tryptophan-rich sensory protein